MTETGSNPLRGTDWYPLLKDEFDKKYWKDLQAFVAAEGPKVCPPPDRVYSALQLTPYAETKVVIVGQDPYARDSQADGLCFSASRGEEIPHSLVNILIELHGDMGVPIPGHGSLEPWARRGVLMLNTILTVREGDSLSHRCRGWERFTDEVIRLVATKTDSVFILWGRYAQKKMKVIGTSCTVIASSHPSRRSAKKGFLGSKPFSWANCFLVAAGKEPIDWSLTD